MPEINRILLVEDSSAEVELIALGLAEAGLANAVDVVARYRIKHSPKRETA